VRCLVAAISVQLTRNKRAKRYLVNQCGAGRRAALAGAAGLVRCLLSSTISTVHDAAGWPISRSHSVWLIILPRMCWHLS